MTPRFDEWRAQKSRDEKAETASGRADDHEWYGEDGFDPVYTKDLGDDYAYGEQFAGEDEQPRASKRKTPHTRKRHPLRIALVAVFALVVAGAGVAFAYFGGIASNLHSGVDDNLRNVLVETDVANEPFYMVLMGTDRSRYRQDYEDYGDQFRSDSMMLARVDAPNRKVTLVSIHRDILYDFGKDGVDKINTAYALGGPAKVIEVISALAGVNISHYAEIDFDGFSELVDELGGVEVNVPIDIDDPDVGGSLDAGLQTLNGEQALMLCRARNNYADIVGDPDLMRAANQRAVLSAIAAKVMSADLSTIAGTVQTLSRFVTTDLSASDIVGLAQAFHEMNPAEDVYTGMTPTEGVYIDGGWYESLDKPAWAAMMQRVDAGLPPEEQTVVDEATGTVMATAGATGAAAGASGHAASGASATSGSAAATSSSASPSNSGSSADSATSASSPSAATPATPVALSSFAKSSAITVANGCGIEGLAGRAAEVLRQAGCTNVAVITADEGDYPKSLIIYDEATGSDTVATEIASVLGKGTVMVNDGTYTVGTGYLVLLGKDCTATTFPEIDEDAEANATSDDAEGQGSGNAASASSAAVKTPGVHNPGTGAVVLSQSSEDVPDRGDANGDTTYSDDSYDSGYDDGYGYDDGSGGDYGQGNGYGSGE